MLRHRLPRAWGAARGHLQQLPGHGAGHPARGGPAGAGVAPDEPCQPQPCCDSVKAVQGLTLFSPLSFFLLKEVYVFVSVVYTHTYMCV